VAGRAGRSFENAMRVTLPLGISFYTFQSMSYSIDVYRGHTRAMRRPTISSATWRCFHQLVAGPIVRFSEIADPAQARRHSIDKFARGVALFSLGLAMKVLLANPLRQNRRYGFRGTKRFHTRCVVWHHRLLITNSF
jgi:alginate O-acetyltransferase complex protein AlgI